LVIEPPYPADTRAKGWRFELDYERIRQSDTWALTPAEHRPWLLMLWMVSWEQTPCGSMPADDELIAARIGMAPESFAQVKRILLRGWTKGSDGRLYHKVITERVLEMVAAKEREKTRKAQYRKRQKDCPTGQPPDNHGTDMGVPRESGGRDDTGTGTSYSVAKATGAEAPDPIWDTGLSYLASCGVPEKGARSFLGKMRQALKDDLLVAELLTKAQKQQVSDPLAWLRAAAGRKTQSGRSNGGVVL
jgi:uncharacterized protein YdaU (DUF1376 family)